MCQCVAVQEVGNALGHVGIFGHFQAHADLRARIIKRKSKQERTEREGK